MLLPFIFAIVINTVSPQTVNSVEDLVTVSASGSGLQNGTQYLQAVWTKEGSTTNYFGFTKNLSGEWYQYKSSPSTSDLSGYFFNFPVVGASWSGTLQTKIDINDDGFSGPGNYLLKLAKYVSSSTPTYSDPVTITVNVTLTPTPTPTPTPTITSTPTPTPSPTKVLTPVLTVTKKVTPTPTEKEEEEIVAPVQQVLAASVSAVKSEVKKESKDYLSLIMISTGILLFLASGIVLKKDSIIKWYENHR